MATVRYTVANGHILVEKRAGTRKFYSGDALGSTVALYDGSQTKTDTFSYWPYGETRTSSGSTGTKYKFVGTLGCRTQADGGIYMRARVEMPQHGLWSSVDPFWPALPAFQYVFSNPLSLNDPWGLCPDGRTWSFYKWLYTGDGCASDEVYEAALLGARAGADCYIDCMRDLNAQLAAILLGVCAGETLLLPAAKTPQQKARPLSRPDSFWIRKLSIASRRIPWLHRLLQDEAIRLKDLLKKHNAWKAGARAGVAGIAVAETVLAGVCAYLCSQSDILEEWQSQRNG